MSVPDVVLHDAPCLLSQPSMWENRGGLGWEAMTACSCPPATLPASMQPDIDEKERLVAEAFTRPLADTDLPHPGISDEFWAEVPEADRETFSAYLVKQEAVKLISEGMQVPYGLLDVPEVTARRGGIQFTGGWRAPSDTIYPQPSQKLTKKQLRAQVESLRTTIRRQGKLLRQAKRREDKKDRRIAKLQRIIERLG